MKVYRVHFSNRSDSSCGFAYFYDIETAIKAADKWRKDESDGDPSYAADIETLDFTLTRAGLITALRRCGSHPDNG